MLAGLIRAIHKNQYMGIDKLESSDSALDGDGFSCVVVRGSVMSECNACHCKKAHEQGKISQSSDLHGSSHRGFTNASLKFTREFARRHRQYDEWQAKKVSR